MESKTLPSRRPLSLRGELTRNARNRNNDSFLVPLQLTLRQSHETTDVEMPIELSNQSANAMFESSNNHPEFFCSSR
jgi:hypothetical protein